VQYYLNGTYNSLFSISALGNLTWSNPSTAPTQETYQTNLIVQQNCSSLILLRSTNIFITIRNFPTNIATSTISSSRLDNSTIYAIIASVGAFILIIIAVLFIIIYYKIQRAKHRVPPFFQIRKRSPAHGLTFLKSRSPLNDSSPYTLGVRDDDSSNSTTSDQTMSSPLNNRLLSGHYKVNEPPMNTTIEELLSSYDNRSTSSSSSSSGLNDHILSTNIGSFRTTIRESNDHPHLDTINEDIQWVNNHQQQRRVNGLKHSFVMPEDSMDIISESHEVDNTKDLRVFTNACLNCLNSNSINHVCSSFSCSSLLSTSTHLLFSSSSSSYSGSTTTVAACQQTTTTTSTVEVGPNRSCSLSHAQFSPNASTRC